MKFKRVTDRTDLPPSQKEDVGPAVYFRGFLGEAVGGRGREGASSRANNKFRGRGGAIASFYSPIDSRKESDIAGAKPRLSLEKLVR